MNEEMLKYVKSLYLPDFLMKNIEAVLKHNQFICDEPIQDIFISNPINEDGSQEIEDLFIFTENYYLEISEYTTMNNCTIGIVPIRKVDFIEFELQDYDFEAATSLSRFTLNLYFESDDSSLIASKENCDTLKNIYEKYFKNRLI